MGKTLIIADAHVRERTFTNNTAVKGDAYAALRKVAAARGDADSLLIPGDWFDGNRPSASDLEATYGFLSLFRDVYFIRGNHDSSDSSFLEAASGLSSATAFHDIESSEAEVGGAVYAGVSWRDAGSRQRLHGRLSEILSGAASDRRPRVVAMHCAFMHMLGFDGLYQETLESLAETMEECGVPRDARMLFAVGHVHRQDERPVPGYPGCRVLSPGSLYPTRFNYAFRPDGSPEQYGVWMLDNGDLGVTFIDSTVRRYGRLRFGGDVRKLRSDLAAFASSGASGLPPLCQVELEPGVEPPADAAGDTGVILQFLKADDGGGAAAQPEDDGYTLAEAAADEFDDEDMKDLARQIVDSADPVGTAGGWLSDWGVELNSRR